ncbi:hypothetical protein [Candidatus Enterococcus clewellii]|uniref:Uncharacterized protein n=1 Tax=Candidatus Enterococcus clewellii TaxID=1834193 RepID=A0A242K9J5_9ENTE|nr:hypothetical protein [Enterococcus sp. 9E7_DIV0242]OTP17448.1 hypothetical protein A5888_001586 [Enterococcus sp. 9E7_DIV0242]
MRVIKKQNGGYTYEYKGNLTKEVKKSVAEQERIKKVLPYLEFSYKEAKKAYESKQTRLGHLNDFIQLANEELKKEDKENESVQ